METIKLDKSRSIKASIVDAWHLFALDWRNYLKQLVFPACYVGMAGAFFFEVILLYVCHHFIPALRLHQTGMDSLLVKAVFTPGLALVLTMVASLLVVWVLSSCYKGKLLGLISSYAASGAFPDEVKISMNVEEGRLARKNMVMMFFLTLITVILLGVVGGLAYFWQMKLLLLCPLVLVYFWTMGNIALLQYTLGGQSLMKSLSVGVRKSLGYAFIVQVLTMIPMLLLAAVFFLPAIIYALSMVAAEDSFLVGDAVSIPSYVSFVFFIFNTLGFAIVFLFNSVRIWSLTMKLNFYERNLKAADSASDANE